MSGGLRPDVAAYLARLAAGPALEELTPGAARAAVEGRRQEATPPVPVGHVEDLALDLGDRVVAARWYRPAPSDEGAAGPLVVFLHGGGWVVGSLDTHDRLCRALCRASGSPLLSVGYRLAPEHPFPAAFADARDAVAYASAHRDDLGAAVAPLVLAGDSAGANLVAAVVHAGPAPRPEVALQVLLYPVLDADLDTPSYRRWATGAGLTRAAMAWFWDHYVPDRARRSDPRAAPLRAPEVAGAPPTLVISAGCDPLLSEGEAYVARLRGAGVAVAHRSFPAVVHGFATAEPPFPESAEVVALVGRVVRHGLAAATPGGARR